MRLLHVNVPLLLLTDAASLRATLTGGVKEHHQHKKQHRLFSSLQKECLTETDSALEM